MSVALFLPVVSVFAHEGETEFTNLAEAEWVGPLVAVLVIVAAVIIARTIRGSDVPLIGTGNEEIQR
ncbi:MAG: hypothetical protein HYY60_00875 [Parcubacteria group bacterium]|nr:hypothetical protein [Parcubacteria group bacterium]MBI3075344.1 hypothetical protein [Parcubacteria group bacterium]